MLPDLLLMLERQQDRCILSQASFRYDSLGYVPLARTSMLMLKRQYNRCVLFQASVCYDSLGYMAQAHTAAALRAAAAAMRSFSGGIAPVRDTGIAPLASAAAGLSLSFAALTPAELACTASGAAAGAAAGASEAPCFVASGLSPSAVPFKSPMESEQSSTNCLLSGCTAVDLME